MCNLFKTRRALIEKNERLENEIANFMKKLETQTSLTNTARNEAYALRKENQTLNTTISELQSNIESLTGQNSQLKGINAELQKQVEELKAKQQPRGKNGRFKPRKNK